MSLLIISRGLCKMKKDELTISIELTNEEFDYVVMCVLERARQFGFERFNKRLIAYLLRIQCDYDRL
jgi:hypothetical protein